MYNVASAEIFATPDGNSVQFTESGTPTSGRVTFTMHSISVRSTSSRATTADISSIINMQRQHFQHKEGKPVEGDDVEEELVAPPATSGR